MKHAIAGSVHYTKSILLAQARKVKKKCTKITSQFHNSHWQKIISVLKYLRRGCGGIGRHVWFRLICRKACRFNSCHPHQIQKRRHRLLFCISVKETGVEPIAVELSGGQFLTPVQTLVATIIFAFGKNATQRLSSAPIKQGWYLLPLLIFMKNFCAFFVRIWYSGKGWYKCFL